MVSAPSCELKTCTPATCSAWASGHFSAQTARRGPFAANRAWTPRAPWRSPPVRAGKDQSAGRAPAACSNVQGDGGPGKAQGALDGAQPIGATEITFDIGDKAIECLGRASAV